MSLGDARDRQTIPIDNEEKEYGLRYVESIFRFDLEVNFNLSWDFEFYFETKS